MVSTVGNERYCTILLQQSLPTDKNVSMYSQDEILKGLESPKIELKINAIKNAIFGLLNGEKFSKVLMHIIRYCSTHNDHTLKKLLMIYWEIAPKYETSSQTDNAKGKAPKLLPEMILVCNALLNDLNHSNEYIRGSMLRFLCKVKERELLEPLKDAVKSNLLHRHAYVRRNAVMTIYSLYQTFGESLIPDAPELIVKLITTENDMATRRNAFLMLFDCSQDIAVNYLMNTMDQIGKYGDGFSLVILEMTRKVCRQDPSQKARFIRCIFQLLNSSSPAVSYEAAWTLVTLSSAPTAVRAAAKTYAGLLSSQSDNNIKLIVLDRLNDLKKHHAKVLQEVMMDIMRALSSPSLDICRKVLEIALDLVSLRNIEEVVNHLKRQVVKTQDKSMEKATEYRHLLIQAIHSLCVKFPDVANHVVHLLMEFLNTEGAMDVILFVRAMCESYADLRSTILQKLLVSFADIQIAKVYRVALWILGEYSLNNDSDISIYDAARTIFDAVGPIPLSAQLAKSVPAYDSTIDDTAMLDLKPVTKSVVLADGTYATETSYNNQQRLNTSLNPVVDSLEDEGCPALRKLIINGDFFLGAAIGATLTKLCLRSMGSDTRSEAATDPVKNLIVQSIRVMCGVVLYGESKESKFEIDEDSKRRIYAGIRMLLDPQLSEAAHTILTKSCRFSYQQLLSNQKADQLERKKPEEPLAHVDDLITFRHLRGKKALGSTDIDIDDGADISRAVGHEGSHEFNGKLRHVHQLTGFADPVYAEAYLTVHDYDIVLEILVVNRLPQTLNNLSVELSTIGDLKVVERPQPQTIGPLDQRTVKANIKVSSTETSHIFGTIVYESASGADKTYVNLNEIHLDIMDYIVPATCSDADFRSMWAEFEWENKVAVNTEITNVFAFLNHIADKTKMRCLTPTSTLGADTNFLAANLYAESVFGECALVNLSVEKQEKGRINGYIRIRSKTQGIALSLGDRITSIQRGDEDAHGKRKRIAI